MRHILIVDDVSTNLKCVGFILKNKYKVTMIKSGREAVACLPAVSPDLVLLDIHMQEMDGYEVLGHIKGNPRTADIPVILFTADTEEYGDRKGYDMGAAGYIRKPFEPRLLLDTIEGVLQTEE